MQRQDLLAAKTPTVNKFSEISRVAARQKAIGEAALANLGGLQVRTSTIMGRRGSNMSAQSGNFSAGLRPPNKVGSA